MAIITKLNNAWNELTENQLVFEFRALVQDLKQQVDITVQRIDVIAASDNFTDVDPELKAEGLAIRAIINTCKSDFSSHSDFIDWIQP